jgi:hypothetical protein
MAFTHFDVEFTRDGEVFDASQADAVLAAMPGMSDVIAISHGWNNDKADAASLYDSLFASVSAVLPGKPRVAGRDVLVIRIFWPSKRFTAADLIPGGGASLDLDQNRQAVLDLLAELKRDPRILGGQEIDPARAARVDRARACLDALDSPTARREYLEQIRGLLDPAQKHADDASDQFFSLDPEVLFNEFERPVLAPAPAGGGGAADLGGAASGLTDLMSGAQAAARRIANYATYYQMKERSGIVGSTGVNGLLRRVREASPNVRLHLVGHSFGGRLVTAAAAGLDPGTQADSIALLQAAYSHNGLARDFDGDGHDGFFRPLIDGRRASGPIVITYTKNDQAVGIAYPLASRIAFQDAAALGDRNDPYGGMGRNGAQHTPEVESSEGELLDTDHSYAFQPGGIYNLLADAFIHDHGDVTGPQVANALLDAMAAI